ncbi:MAG: TraR/DksA family transcriptional regulator [Acidimicrobiia bacterium]
MTTTHPDLVPEVTQRLRVALEHALADTLSNGPPADLEPDIAEAVQASARQLVGDIEAALGRLDEGTYGLCEDCGSAVPVARLEALPHTRHCVSCAVRH